MRMTEPLHQTSLHSLHAELGAKFTPFAGYDMPVQYGEGMLAEHRWTREAAGLFDVSHMGQIILHGADAAAALETLVPVSVQSIAEGRQRYGLFTTDAGGVIDDLMIANTGHALILVVNASRKMVDFEHLATRLPAGVTVEWREGRSLIALQGPRAAEVLVKFAPGVAAMKFMDYLELDLMGATCGVSRSGYTGEDGFEISLPDTVAQDFAAALLADEAVKPIGLGARDTLRLEAGLSLYGNELGEDITPVEAGLSWAIQKVRRRGGAREGGFPGAERILAELEAGAPRKLVALRPEGRAPIRAGAALFAEDGEAALGAVTSGGFGPTVEAPVALGLVDAAAPDRLFAEVRGKRLPAAVTALPFVPHRYHR